MERTTPLIWNPILWHYLVNAPMLGIHQLADERFHLHVEILAVGRAPGKLKYAASSESIWGMWTNDSSPAQKAQELREAILQKGI